MGMGDVSATVGIRHAGRLEKLLLDETVLPHSMLGWNRWISVIFMVAIYCRAEVPGTGS